MLGGAFQGFTKPPVDPWSAASMFSAAAVMETASSFGPKMNRLTEPLARFVDVTWDGGDGVKKPAAC